MDISYMSKMDVAHQAHVLTGEYVRSMGVVQQINHGISVKVADCFYK